jgi:hypothetical protein
VPRVYAYSSQNRLSSMLATVTVPMDFWLLYINPGSRTCPIDCLLVQFNAPHQFPSHYTIRKYRIWTFALLPAMSALIDRCMILSAHSGIKSVTSCISSEYIELSRCMIMSAHSGIRNSYLMLSKRALMVRKNDCWSSQAYFVRNDTYDKGTTNTISSVLRLHSHIFFLHVL